MRNSPTGVQSFWAAVGLLFCVGIEAARAHEFWIEPVHFAIQAGGQLRAHLKVGQNLEGNKLLYLPQQFHRFDIPSGEQSRPVRSRVGDSPAVDEFVDEAGLHILSYVSTDSLLTYLNPHKFETFLRKEGIEWVAGLHRERGLPESGFTEAFQRFAKALVRVGEGDGSDRALGLDLELVVQTNPYRRTATEVTVQLLWRGRPFPNAQINIFRRYRGDVRRHHMLTGAEGRIRVPVADAPGTYLLNAVHMIDPGRNDHGIVWKSLWASTTFEIEK